MTINWRVTKSDTLTVPCPECEAQAGKPCVYVPVNDMPENSVYTYKMRTRMRRVGSPTKRPHNGRFNAVRDQIMRKMQKKQRLERDAELKRNVPTAEHRNIVRLHQAWDYQEWFAMRTWLRQWSGMLTALDRKDS